MGLEMPVQVMLAATNSGSTSPVDVHLGQDCIAASQCTEAQNLWSCSGW